jgi:Putative zinc-finger
MQHLDEGTIHSWLDGALSADEAARVEAHVKECPQCAAAVAEARGFIAGASRILTALDNAPRGVIPVAATRKRVDPIVWRVAATLLVVAVGTFAVFRNGGREAQTATTSADTARNSVKAVTPMTQGGGDQAARTTAEPTSPIGQQGNSPQRAAIVRSGGSTEKGAAKKRGTDAFNGTEQTSAALAPRINYSPIAQAPASQTNIPLHENKRVAGQAGGAVGGNISTSSGYAQAAPPSTQLLSEARVRGTAALDAAREPEPLKEIGHPRRFGAKVTLYEVAPGDTVTLTEAIPLDLSEVVVTGAATALATRQATGKSAAAPSRARTDAAVITSAADSQHAAAVPSPAPAISASAPTSQVGMVNAPHTITWTDPATGITLALTGRMSEPRLQQIKIRIERERAAAAAKKKP